MLFLRSISLVISFLLCVASCANPAIIPPVSGNETMLSCTALLQQIGEAEHYRKMARSEDRFKVQYILILPAIASLVQMNEAEKAATLRKQQLETIAAQKACLITNLPSATQ